MSEPRPTFPKSLSKEEFEKIFGQQISDEAWSWLITHNRQEDKDAP